MPNLSITVVVDETPYPSEAPANMPAHEFIDEILDTLKIPDGNWVLRNKQTGRTLDPGRSLEENGVVSGHHLYAHPAPVELPANGKPPLPPPPHRSNWSGLLVALLALLLLAGFTLLGYVVGKSSSGEPSAKVSELQAELDKTRGSLKALRPDIEARNNKIQVLTAELDKLVLQVTETKADRDARVKRMSSLGTELSRAQVAVTERSLESEKLRSELIGAKQREDQLTAKIDGLHRVLREAQRRETELDSQVRQLKSETRTAQDGARRQRWHVTRTSVKGRAGTVFDVSGGLGGLPCRVFTGDPEVVEVSQQPSSGDGYSRVQIRLRKSGSYNLVLFWGSIESAGG